MAELTLHYTNPEVTAELVRDAGEQLELYRLCEQIDALDGIQHGTVTEKDLDTALHEDFFTRSPLAEKLKEYFRKKRDISSPAQALYRSASRFLPLPPAPTLSENEALVTPTMQSPRSMHRVEKPDISFPAPSEAQADMLQWIEKSAKDDAASLRAFDRRFVVIQKQMRTLSLQRDQEIIQRLSPGASFKAVVLSKPYQGNYVVYEVIDRSAGKPRYFFPGPTGPILSADNIGPYINRHAMGLLNEKEGIRTVEWLSGGLGHELFTTLQTHNASREAVATFLKEGDHQIQALATHMHASGKGGLKDYVEERRSEYRKYGPERIAALQESLRNADPQFAEAVLSQADLENTLAAKKSDNLENILREKRAKHPDWPWDSFRRVPVMYVDQASGTTLELPLFYGIVAAGKSKRGSSCFRVGDFHVFRSPSACRSGS